MPKPTKPTVPSPALRSDPSTFSARLEDNLLFWSTLVDYQDESIDYMDAGALEITATALAGDLPSLAGNAGKLLGVNKDETAATFISGSLSNRNRIINGGFSINQRGVSGSVVLSAGAYGHDMWKAGASGCSYTFATSENVTTLTISSGSLIQVISGASLQTGTHTLSFSGTVQMKIDGGAAGDSGMTGTATGGTNLEVETSGTGTVTAVQFETGDTATPFEHRLNELTLCKMYYQRFNTSRFGLAQIYSAAGGVVFSGAFDGEMADVPTITATGTITTSGTTFSNGYNLGAIAGTTGTSAKNFSVIFSAASSGWTPGHVTTLSFDSSNYLEISAEP